MKPYRYFVATTCLLLGSLALSCCKKTIPPPDNALEDPAELREAIEARASQVDSARFREVVLDSYVENDRYKLRQLILVERPDKLRVQTRIPGMNEVASLLVTNGDEFALHDRKKETYYTGRPTPKNINKLLPVQLSARDVVRVMLGGAPWDRFDGEPGDPTLEWNRRTGRYRYAVATSRGGELAMEVRHTDYAVVSVTEHDGSGDLVYEYTTDGWKRQNDLAVPVFRRFVAPEHDLDFSLDVGETQLGAEFPNQLFSFPPPPGSKIIHVEG